MVPNYPAPEDNHGVQFASPHAVIPTYRQSLQQLGHTKACVFSRDGCLYAPPGRLQRGVT